MTALVYVSICLLGYAVVQKRLDRTVVTGPMVFVALGLLASETHGFGLIELEAGTTIEIIDFLFQATLTLVLFTDAAALHFSSWRKDAALPGRLLGIGLPLTIALGTLLAAWLFTDLGIWEAAIIAAIIAPTDAALGQAVISNPRVPERVRQALDVESGLNDGVALPFLLIFIGLAEQSADNRALATFVREIGVAVGVGAIIGFLGGALLLRASRAGWMNLGWSSIALTTLAALSFLVADLGGGSGFIAAFVAGLAYGRATKDEIRANEAFATGLGVALVQISFLLLGASVLGTVFERVTWQVVVMAVLALTVVRIVPVMISMIGAKMAPPTVLYLGWFGPRGLATVVFAVLVIKDADLPATDTITTVAVLTVLFSVFAHGATAYVGSQRYADWYHDHGESAELAEAQPVSKPHLRFGRHQRPRIAPQPPDDPPSAASDK